MSLFPALPPPLPLVGVPYIPMAEDTSIRLAGFKPRINGAGATQHSEFAKRASRIGLGIHSTSQKLSKLAQLAKRTSMFDDPAAEINELTGAYAVAAQSTPGSRW